MNLLKLVDSNTDTKQSLKLDGVDNRPSTAKAPPIVKNHPISKIAVTLEPPMQFRCPTKFRRS